MKDMTPYRPSNELFADLRREMDDVLSSWFGRGTSRAVGAWRGEAFFAPVEVQEKDNNYIVKLDVPGVREDDIKVTLQGDVLTIRGERKEEKSETRGDVRYSERSYGSFSRSLTMPSHVQAEGVRARTTQGVLEVMVPKAPGAPHREVKVERG